MEHIEHVDEALSLKSELETARAEEAEALRRANNLRIRGASRAEVEQAIREASSCHAAVARLTLELRKRMH